MAATALRLKVVVQPRARHTQILSRHDDAIKLQVKAPPVDGAANEAVIELLATTLQVPRRNVRIVQGASGRRKVVEVTGADSACRERLEALLRTVDKEVPRR